MGTQNWNDFFITPDQRGQRLLNESKFAEAAAEFQDPFRQGTALFRNGDFEDAASIFGTLPGADAAFNQANSLLMHGQYEQAIKRYDRALLLRQDWSAAITNQRIAMARAKNLELEGGNMTGGKLGADDIVFDENPTKNPGEAGDETIMAESTSDEAMRAVWLRQVQTTPQQFLRSKFAYQLATQAKATDSDDSRSSNAGVPNE